MSSAQLYDTIGATYTVTRRTEPRIAEQVWAALGDSRTVLNVGAGAGSYEPSHRDVTAVEPSAVMRAQRPAGAAPCVAASAESLPFEDQSFDAAMAVATIDHWQDPIAGLREMRRVARRVVVFTTDASDPDRFWLTRDYLPEYAALWVGRPSLTELAGAIAARTEPVPIPWDCADGFYEAYWRRPEAYLDDHVRRGMSIWARVGPDAEQRAACVTTSHPAGGPNATATSSISTQQSLTAACLWPDPALLPPHCFDLGQVLLPWPLGSDSDHFLDRLPGDAQFPREVGLRESLGEQCLHDPPPLPRQFRGPPRCLNGRRAHFFQPRDHLLVLSRLSLLPHAPIMTTRGCHVNMGLSHQAASHAARRSGLSRQILS
jgi:SAM-dependent methyltransferase